MQRHNGTRTGEGSFNVALKELFYKADKANRYKLVEAFPEFFGEEVPEFGTLRKGGVSENIYARLQLLPYNERVLFGIKEFQLLLDAGYDVVCAKRILKSFGMPTPLIIKIQSHIHTLSHERPQ